LIVLKAHLVAGAFYGSMAAKNAAAKPGGDRVVAQSCFRTGTNEKSRHEMPTTSAMVTEDAAPDSDPMTRSLECRAARDERRERELVRTNDFYAAVLAMAGHDLRQPLQVIAGSLELPAQKLPPGPERRNLERGQRATAQLAEKLDQLIDALRVQQQCNSVQTEPVRLQPLFQRLARQLDDQARQKRIDLRFVRTDATVVSSAVMLDGILRNLAGNALQHTATGGRVMVGCRRRGAEIRIEVRDNGAGIVEQELAHVFEPFARLDTAPPAGLGLGLFIVERAAACLGHRVEVRSTPGRGCYFAIAAQAIDDRGVG
jgi:signal transduction histidine kinase